MSRTGLVGEEANEGVYRVLMEGLESFAATAQLAGEPDQVRYAVAQDGRRYLTSSPDLAEPYRPAKDEWWRDAPEDARIMPRRVR